MIIDKLNNAAQYRGIHPLIEEGLNYLQNTDFTHVEPGKIILKEGVLFAIVSEYDTKTPDQNKAEAHRKFADIQYIVSGNEQMGYAAYEGQPTSIEYNPEKDVIFYNTRVDYTMLTPESFAIFFPGEIHQPGISINGQAQKVKKVVVKVLIKPNA